MKTAKSSPLYLSLVFFLWAAISSPVRAEWEYTRWGMTAEEVKEVNTEPLIPVSPREQSFTTDAKAKTLWKTRWTLEQFNFDVYLNFTGSPPTLSEVILISEGDNQGIVTALSNKYGPPTSGQGNLRIQRRPGNFSLIPTNPDQRGTQTVPGTFSAGVHWETERDIIELNTDTPERVIIRFLPNR